MTDSTSGSPSGKKRKGRAKGAVLTRELYQQLIDAYRDNPGNAAAASRLCHVDPRTAQKMWFGPVPKIYPWAKPIKEVLEQERLLEMKRKRDAERKRADAEAALRDARRRALQEARLADENTLKLARANVLGILGSVNMMLPAVRNLATRVLGAAKDPNFPVKDAIMILSRHSAMHQRAINAAAAILDASRLDRGEPTAIIGVGASPSLDYEQAIAELREAESLYKAMEGDLSKMRAAAEEGESEGDALH